VPFFDVEKNGTTRQATDVNVIRRKRCARWITKTTDAHLEYVILIAFPPQQWLNAPVLRFTYTVCLAQR
jgi:hypothetical protein